MGAFKFQRDPGINRTGAHLAQRKRQELKIKERKEKTKQCILTNSRQCVLQAQHRILSAFLKPAWKEFHQEAMHLERACWQKQRLRSSRRGLVSQKKAAVLLCAALGDISDAFISQTCLSLCLNLTWPHLHDQKLSQGLINTVDLQENFTLSQSHFHSF